MSLTGRHAVVTGGGSGVGAAIAVSLAATGASVTITGRRAEQLAQVCDQHPGIVPAACDVTNRDEFEHAMDQAHSRTGPIDIMVANAGVANSKPFHRLTPGDLSEMLAVNVLGVFNSFQIAQASIGERGWGRLIAIASTAGLIGYPYVSHYCASKHAVIGMTRALAQETAKRGITVNAVCPSYVDTPMTDRTIENIIAQTGRTREQAIAALTEPNPQGRLITAQEVAGTVLWLCSDVAAGVNGQAIAINGGET